MLKMEDLDIGTILVDNEGDVCEVVGMHTPGFTDFRVQYRDPRVTVVNPPIITFNHGDLGWFKIYVEKTVEPLIEYSTTIQSKYKL